MYFKKRVFLVVLAVVALALFSFIAFNWFLKSKSKYACCKTSLAMIDKNMQMYKNAFGKYPFMDAANIDEMLKRMISADLVDDDFKNLFYCSLDRSFPYIWHMQYDAFSLQCPDYCPHCICGKNALKIQNGNRGLVNKVDVGKTENEVHEKTESDRTK